MPTDAGLNEMFSNHDFGAPNRSLKFYMNYHMKNFGKSYILIKTCKHADVIFIQCKDNVIHTRRKVLSLVEDLWSRVYVLYTSIYLFTCKKHLVEICYVEHKLFSSHDGCQMWLFSPTSLVT